jgi:hypothetical protein
MLAMDRLTRITAISAVLLGLWGCGSGDKSKPQAKTAAAANGGPDAAVFQFLEAVRVGNDTKASEMLTKVARQKTSEAQLVVAPPGSQTASFEVGEVELDGESKAQVASKWTDIGDDGKPNTDVIVWLLRQDPEGWRIAGMATKLFDNQPPLILNFEDPEEMVQKQRQAEEEMIRREQQATAQKPEATAPAQRQ